MTGKRKHTDVEAAPAEEGASGAGSRPRETTVYEPPRVAVIGSLEELTQGGGSVAEDAFAPTSPP
jgi:hypothetical protein